MLELLETAFNAPWTVLLSLALHGPFCRTETAERVDIPENAWVVVTEVSRCSVVDPGQLQIYGENTQSKEKRPILALSTEEDTHVEYHPEGYLTITLPNLVEITFQSDQLDKYKIEYRYLPKDDPVERRNYVRWLHHPHEPDADAWCRKHLLMPGIPHEGGHCF